MVHDGLQHDGTTLLVYKGVRSCVFVMAITSNHGFGKVDTATATTPAELVGPSAAESLIGIRMFRTEMLRTSRANHLASNDELGELIQSVGIQRAYPRSVSSARFYVRHFHAYLWMSRCVGNLDNFGDSHSSLHHRQQPKNLRLPRTHTPQQIDDRRSTASSRPMITITGTQLRR